MKRIIFTWVWILLIIADSEAGFEHLAQMYGVAPADVALAGAAADGNVEIAAAYHNPAALADLARTGLGLGYLLAQPFFEGGRAGDEKNFRQPNQVVSLNVTLDIGRFFPSDYPLGMGVNLLVDDNFRTIVAFDDQLYPNGQFIRYGVRSFNLAHGLGVRIIEGLNAGVGYLLTYSAEVNLIQDIQIDAATENEQIKLTGRPAFSPLCGVQWKSENVQAGLVYRSRLLARVDPVTGDTTPKVGETVIDVYPTEMKFIDGYMPQQFVLGIGLFPNQVFSGTLQGEYWNWAQFNNNLALGNQSRREVDIRTRDVWVPRLGLRFRPDEAWELRTGYAYESSPFVKLGSRQKLLLDNDRQRVAAGAGYQWRSKYFVAPVSFDAAAFGLFLSPREEQTIDQDTLRSRGWLIGGSAAMTFHY